LNPKVWWILIGTNDVHINCSDDSVVAGNLGIVQELQQRRPESTIVINSILPRSQPTDGFPPRKHRPKTKKEGAQPLDLRSWRHISRINQRLQCHVQKLKGVEFFDATNLFLTNGSESSAINAGSSMLNTNLMPDGLHPNGAGSLVWGKEIVNTLLRLL
jgi:lysophospholipase L1-like esterase